MISLGSRVRALLAGEVAWMATALAVAAIIAVIDLSLPRNANIAGALVLAPFLASAGARPRRVGYVGGLAVVLAFFLAVADGSGLSASLARIVVIAIGTVVASRAALVRLHRERDLVDLTKVSRAAQETIVYAPPPFVRDVGVATWYQSAVRAASVGGDCFEVLETPFGTRALIGDVRGHGLPSVRLAALVLGAFRTLAFLTEDLGDVARELDLLTARYAAPAVGEDGFTEEFVTAVVVEVRGSDLWIVNCGHPSPYLLETGGRVWILDASDPIPPLGLGFGSVPVPDRVHAPAGSRLILYTDGLVEARDAAGAFFDPEPTLRALCEASLPDLVLGIATDLATYADDQIHDDVALVALQPDALPTGADTLTSA